MERAHRDAERYHEDHYNPAFYVKERKRAVLLFLLFSDTFGVLVIKPFENKQKEEKEHDCGLSYLEKPVLGICQPCHYPYPENIGPGYNPYHSGGNKQYFSVYSVFHVSVLYNPADTGNKDSETRSHTDGFRKNNVKCLKAKGICRFVPNSSAYGF